MTPVATQKQSHSKLLLQIILINVFIAQALICQAASIQQNILKNSESFAENLIVV